MPNPDAIYFMAFFNTQEVGPIVIDVPPGDAKGSLTGNIITVWQTALEDVGLLGLDKGAGGKFVILPPGYTDTIPDGYTPLPSDTYGGYALLRSNLQSHRDADVAASIAYGKRAKIYPLSAAAHPPETIFTDVKDVNYVSTIRYDVSFFHALNRVVQSEPWIERDRVMLDPLRTLGIEQGKPFAPAARMQAILERAAKAGRAQMLVAAFGSSRPDRVVWQDRRWEWAALRYENGDFELPTGIDVEARDRWFAQAVGMSPKMFLRTAGAGSLYWLGLRDKNGAYLDGGKTYKLSVPQPVPQQLFWSVTVYDSATRSQIQTDQDKAALRSLVELQDVAKTGTTDLYFGPSVPAGKERQWIKTIPGKGWFVYFRLYGPEGPAFDGSWKPGDFEAVP
jgi:hypothetical protein